MLVSSSIYIFRCEQYSATSLQNRYFPIIAFSLHVYWRIDRSLDSPVRVYEITSTKLNGLTLRD